MNTILCIFPKMENEKNDAISLKNKPEKRKSHLISEYFDNGSTILNQLKISSLQKILFSQEKSQTKYEKCLIDDYKNHMGFYISALNDPQFDVFTPSKTLFENCNINLYFDFYKDSFEIKSQIDQQVALVSLGYDDNIIPVLESISTGYVTLSLLKLIEKMKIKNWDNGIMIAKWTDYRLTPPKTFIQKLEIGPDIIEYQGNLLHRNESVDNIEKLKFEKQAILLENPDICTDPSPDVARINSVVDWRKKMWINTKMETKGILQKKKVRENPVSFQTARVETCSKNFEIPKARFESIFKNYQVL